VSVLLRNHVCTYTLKYVLKTLLLSVELFHPADFLQEQKYVLADS